MVGGVERERWSCTQCADSRAAMGVCVAGGGVHVLSELSHGRVVGIIDHPMADDLGPFDRGRPASSVRNPALIVSRICSHSRSQQRCSRHSEEKRPWSERAGVLGCLSHAGTTWVRKRCTFQGGFVRYTA